MGISIRKIFKTISILISSLLFLEIVLRLFWYTPYLDPRYKRDDLKWLEQNVALDHFGYRDREFSLDKPKGVFRIYSLGTSYTFGWYINDPSLSYPKRLEGELSNNFKEQNIEVINAAHPGFSLQDKIDQFKTQGTLFNPDVVTVDLNIFDLTNQAFPPRYINSLFIRKLYIYQATFGNWQRHLSEGRTKKAVLESLKYNSENINRLDKELQDLKNLTNKAGASLAIILFPYYDLQNPNTPYQYTNFHEAIKKIGQNNSITVVDLLEAFNSFQDKKDLILNPTDPHLSVLGNQITAQFIAKTIDFEKLLSQPKIRMQTSKIIGHLNLSIPGLANIISISPTGWVYFDRSYNLGTMNLFLPNNSDKKLFYIEDKLETAKSFTHKGWPGAKIEYRILPSNGNLLIPKVLYGYQAVGINSITGYWNKNDSLASQDLDLTNTQITKDDKNIYIKILNTAEYNKYQMYKVLVDVAVKQFDIDNGIIVDMFKTEVVTSSIKSGQKEITLNLPGKIGSSPSYVWVNNILQPTKTTNLDNSLHLTLEGNIPQDAKIEIPVALGLRETSQLPIIEYSH
jgi:hypothetical protein